MPLFVVPWLMLGHPPQGARAVDDPIIDESEKVDKALRLDLGKLCRALNCRRRMLIVVIPVVHLNVCQCGCVCG